MSKLTGIPPRAQSILLVDDEPDVLESLAGLLETTLDSATVYRAKDAHEAFDVLEHNQVDLIVSDYRMPGMDGLEFLHLAREKYPLTPSILITAYPDQELARRAIQEASVENFLTKPVRPERLMEAVNAALIKARKRRQEAEEFSKRAGGLTGRGKD